MAMDYRSFNATVRVDDGFTCPYCGQNIGQLNIIFAKYVPEGQRILFAYGGCCEAADDSLFELPADTAFSYATLPTVLDMMRKKLDERRGDR